MKDYETDTAFLKSTISLLFDLTMVINLTWITLIFSDRVYSESLTWAFGFIRIVRNAQHQATLLLNVISVIFYSFWFSYWSKINRHAYIIPRVPLKIPVYTTSATCWSSTLKWFHVQHWKLFNNLHRIFFLTTHLQMLCQLCMNIFRYCASYAWTRDL